MTTNAARTFHNVKALIQNEELLHEGMHVIIGLSGGPDSVCLFDLLCRLADDMRLQLYPVHVNHQFRPGAAEADQAFTEALCVERGWPCRSFVYDCARIAAEKNLTSEEAGRKARYEAFGIVAAELLRRGIAAQNVAIAIAQNANDQAETILFRILRGTGTDGLAGIAKKRYETVRYDDTEVSEEARGQNRQRTDQLCGQAAAEVSEKARGQNRQRTDQLCGQATAEVNEEARGAYTQEQAQHSANEGKETGMREELCPCDDARRAAEPVKTAIARIAVVRPLLETQRAEIEQYLSERGMTACIDQTNAEPIYTRNQIRLELLPYLATHYNENIITALNRLGRIAQSDKAYLQETAARAFEEARARAAGERAATLPKQENRACCIPDNLAEEPACSAAVLAADVGTDEAVEACAQKPKVVYLDCETLRALHAAIRTRVYQRALREVGMAENFSSAQAEAIDHILYAASPSARTELADGFRAARVYGRMKFYRARKKDSGQSGTTDMEIGASHAKGVNHTQVEKDRARGVVNAQLIADDTADGEPLASSCAQFAADGAADGAQFASSCAQLIADETADGEPIASPCAQFIADDTADGEPLASSCAQFAADGSADGEPLASSCAQFAADGAADGEPLASSCAQLIADDTADGEPLASSCTQLIADGAADGAQFATDGAADVAVMKIEAAGRRFRLWRTKTAMYHRLLAEGRIGPHGAFRAAALPAGARMELRTRRDGDYLPIRGGRKKLQDFFVDSKIPKNQRDEILLLACGSHVLWILPSPIFKTPVLRQKGRFSAEAKVDGKQEETIIILEISNIL